MRLLAVLSLLALSSGIAVAQYEHSNQYGIPAMLIFGDSTVDAGNNNVFQTIMHSNHLPYGRDFGYPSGRFSNGLLVPDFVAQRLNLSLPFAFTSPNATGSNLNFGANFASAASGFVDSTAALFNVASFTQQLKWFDKYRTQLAQMLGQEHAQSILEKALYVISSGSNDYIYYRLNQGTNSRYNPKKFRTMLVNQASGFMQELYRVGARRFAVINVPPLGCLPTEITAAGMMANNRQCVKEQNQLAESHNKHLKQMLHNARRTLPGSKIAYLDCYAVLFDAIHNPSKYGFQEVHKGCCGTGLVEVGDGCNQQVGTCADSSKFVFWDSFHPTQAMYKIIADIFYDQAVGILA